MLSADFLLTSFVVAVSPGTGVLYTLSAGLSQGRRASLIAALGCTLGIVPHILIVVTGLAAMLHTGTLAYQILKYLGIGYLLFMTWQMLRSDQNSMQFKEDMQVSAWRLACSGTLMNILNPKLVIFFLAFLPQFMSADEPSPMRHLILLGIAFMAITLIVFVGYGMTVASFRNLVQSRPHVMLWLQRCFAMAFVAMSLKLALF
ncbi:LysE family translocator [Edaphovirga cremea]|uniref:LysE family translocator n=1 Tax=Edaphovirga cremea TaxID=2267246 RepID=UPI000DEF7B0A|nr:LysE family translocator [Edaphovirga cremea]